MNYQEYTEKKGKDEMPQITVERIQACLKEIDTEADYQFYNTDIDGCYSARVFLKGPLSATIGANGKGTSKSYCLASGFAELIERIQNQIFFPYQLPPKSKEDIIKQNPPLPNSLLQFQTLDELQKNQNSFLNKIVDKYASSIESTDCQAQKRLLTWLQLDRQFPLWKKTGVLTVPFYHVQTGEYEWLPLELIQALNLSNGMAAGNTLPEALVQGYSELFERYAQCRIVTEKLTPPQIEPTVLLKKYPQISQVIQRIEKSGEYRVIVMDCSLGIDLPVVCGAIINKKKQTFGIRFGAHPDIQIALERIFTEAMQGKSLEEFSCYNRISFYDKKVMSHQNLLNLLKTGTGFYPPEIFKQTPSYKPSGFQKAQEISNDTLLAQTTKQMLSLCGDLYIADVSYLGFPNVLIYAENISEIVPIKYSALKASGNKNEASEILQNLSSIEENQIRKLLETCGLIRNSVLENTVAAMCRQPFNNSVHGGNDQIGFLMAVGNYFLQNDIEAAKLLRECLLKNEPGTDEYLYEEVLQKFFEGMSVHNDAVIVKELLGGIYDENIVEQIFREFSSRSHVFLKLYACSNSYETLFLFSERLFTKMSKSHVWTQNLHQIFGG